MFYNINNYKEKNNDWEIIYENDEKEKLNYCASDILYDIIDDSIKKSEDKDDFEIKYIDFCINDVNFKILEREIKFNINKIIKTLENFITNNMDEKLYNFLSI